MVLQSSIENVFEYVCFQYQNNKNVKINLHKFVKLIKLRVFKSFARSIHQFVRGNKQNYHKKYSGIAFFAGITLLS